LEKWNNNLSKEETQAKIIIPSFHYSKLFYLFQSSFLSQFLNDCLYFRQGLDSRLLGFMTFGNIAASDVPNNLNELTSSSSFIILNPKPKRKDEESENYSI
jgi:hypothetical protein